MVARFVYYKNSGVYDVLDTRAPKKEGESAHMFTRTTTKEQAALICDALNGVPADLVDKTYEAELNATLKELGEPPPDYRIFSQGIPNE